MYPKELVVPMKKELTSVGYQDVTDPKTVSEIINLPGTAFVVINSVCGCAARNARPAAKAAILQSEVKPDRIFTVFAGFDSEAVSKLREFMLPYPPSSPSMALFKDGELVHVIERHHIEGRPAEAIADNLIMAFDEYCGQEV
jgi:putative YphP/YqiW family bacilliredoxin